MSKPPVSKAEWYSGTAGLDYDNVDAITDLERDTFYEVYRRTHGRDAPYGPGFWLDEGLPGHMKRYRMLATANGDPKGADSGFTPPTAEAVWFGLLGFDEGMRYHVHQYQIRGDGTGLSRSQILEHLALAAWWLGSRGMTVVQKAIRAYTWVEPEGPVTMPRNWTTDRTMLASGLDFSTLDLSPAERVSVEAWYLKYEGEMPPYVRALLKYRPRALKAYRNRFENTLREFPNQFIPYAMCAVNALRGYGPGVREGVLLGKGFGMTKSQVVSACMGANNFAGIEMAGLMESAAGDILDAWEGE